MQKATFKVRRQYNVEIPIKIGDMLTYRGHGYAYETGQVTYIFNEGKEIIVDDKHMVYCSEIESINGVKIRDIEGEMTLV